MPYFPGGMAETFPIWEGFAYPIPESVSFEEATFLDGLAVAIHAVRCCGVTDGKTLGVIGLGPIGLLCCQVARSWKAQAVLGYDSDPFPVTLARAVRIDRVQCSSGGEFLEFVRSSYEEGLDAVIDTVGTPHTLERGLSVLARSGTLALVAVHQKNITLATTRLSGERKIMTAANNLYTEFQEAIDLLAAKAIEVKPLITHRFPLKDVSRAFQIMSDKKKHKAFKIILHP
jgi:threonine dehydrogenase-like Zn-dependent dehydrogenase